MSDDPIDLTADELRAALAAEGVPVAASVDPKGADLLRYWTAGAGAAKIRWNTPGDFGRCVNHLTGKVRDPKGLCAEYHKAATGMWPGDKRNVGATAASAEPGVMRSVELARPGSWDLAVGGRREFTVEMLRDAADFYAASGQVPVPVGLGHIDDRFDGDPAFGLVRNIRYAVDEPGHAPGPVLLGDVTEMPGWLHAAAPSRWPNRSIEGFLDVEFAGRTYGLTLTRLAFLGSAPPAMRNLRSLGDVQRALAAGHAIAASAALTAEPAPDPPAQPDSPTPPGSTPAGSTDQEGAGMDPAKIREALGLPPDASDEDVRAALASAGLVAPAAPSDPATPPATATPPAADAPADPPAGDVPQPLAAAAAAHGAVVVDKGVWDELQGQVRQGVQAANKLREQERDTVIGAAVKDGRIPPANSAYWATLYDKDPKGTGQVIASLKRNLIPVAASGYTGTLDPDEDDPFDALFPPTAKGR